MEMPIKNIPGILLGWGAGVVFMAAALPVCVLAAAYQAVKPAPNKT